jgi:hypothetical protein
MAENEYRVWSEVLVWQYVDVIADTPEQALEMAKSGDLPDDSSWEYMFDTSVETGNYEIIEE